MITVLTGGVGGSKLLVGLSRVVAPSDISAVINTSDDIKLFGLHISPDLDIVTYTLAGVIDPLTGWGVSGDTFHCLEALHRLVGDERWFNLGDRDLAVHIRRTQLLREGLTLSEVTEHIRLSFGVAARLIPMTDSYVPTCIVSDEGELHFQEYLVKRRAEPRVRAIYFRDIAEAKPAPAAAEAIARAERVIICPSNPLISIGPILAVPGMRRLLRETRAQRIAVSPLVKGLSLKGPTDKMLAELGREVSALEVARMYQDILDVYVLDEQDAPLKSAVEALGLRVVLARTTMRSLEDKVELARNILALS